MTTIDNAQVICWHCYRTAEEAGQLSATLKFSSAAQAVTNCEQCDRPLVDGESFNVVIEP